MVTDRASTACLCIVLGALYPQYVAGLCSLIMLDLFSHWYHTSATRTGTHKKSSNWLVNVYYSRKVLFTVCAATELWYMSLYMMHFTPGPALPLPASWASRPSVCGALHATPPRRSSASSSSPTSCSSTWRARRWCGASASKVGTGPLARPPQPPKAACSLACPSRSQQGRRMAAVLHRPLHGETLVRTPVARL